MAPADTLVIAHRGAWGELPENTLEAFEHAVRLGADMVELDVRRTADGHLIVYHDATGDLRYDELRAKDSSLRPPLLDDVVRALAGRIALNIELKERECVAETVAMLKRYRVKDCMLSSFLDDVVDEARAIAPKLRRGLVVATDPPTRAPRSDPDYLVLELALAGHAAGCPIPCMVWTVNDVEALDRYLADPAIVGVITDRPELALERRALLTDRTARAERS
jgi:glycerophosphoryl diester phosphodiesterase